MILKDATPAGETNCIAQAREPLSNYFIFLVADGHGRIADVRVCLYRFFIEAGWTL